MGWAGRVTKTSADTLVKIASGEQPIRALDESKTAFRIVIGISAITILTTGVFMWRLIVNSAKLPVAKKSNTNVSSTLVALKEKDTDADGLNDYEELYVYGSSPYLFSSASDGVADGEKVKQGVNPNCQIGKSCTVPTLTVGTNSNGDTNSSVSVSFLRQALVASGASASVVQAADDATILEMYEQATQNGSSTNTNTAVTNTSTTNTSTTGNTNVASNANSTVTNTSDTSSLTYADLESLSGAEIRSLLTSYGIDASNLTQVDDATLKAIFSEAISGN